MKTQESKPHCRPDRGGESSPRSAGGRASHRIAWIVLVVSLIASAGGWRISLEHARVSGRMRFMEEVEAARAALVERLTVYENALRGAVGLFAASQSVERDEWKRYIESVSVAERFPGLDALGFAQRVSRDELDSFQALLEAEQGTAFSIKPVEGEEDLLVIRFLEPEDRLGGLVGQTLNEDAGRHTAAIHARDTGEIVVSGEIRLNGDASGFLMMMPVYRPGSPHGTIEEKRQSFEGLVYARFVTSELIDQFFRKGGATLRLRVFDGNADSTGTLLYDSWTEAETAVRTHTPAYTEQLSLVTGGRRWTLDFLSTPAFAAGTSKTISLMALVGGLVVSLLLFGMVWSLSRTRERAVNMAAEMTAELRGVNERLQREMEDRERAQQSRKDSELLYQSLVESLPLNMFRKDLDGRFTFANQRFCSEVGRPLDQILNKTEFDLFPSAQAALHKQEEDRIIEAGESLEGVRELDLPGSGTRFVQVVKTLLRDSAGKVIGLQGIFWDVTDKHRTELELQRERKLLRTLLDSVPDPIYFKDLDSRFLRVSRAMIDLFKVSDPSEVIGKTDFDFFGEAHARQAYDDEQRIIRTGQPVIGLVEKEDMPDGTIRWVSTTKMPMRDEQERVIGTCGVSRDITRMKEVEEEMREANEQLQREIRDREQAQQSLRDSEALYHSLVETLPLSIFRKDQSGRFTFVNQRFCSHLGKSAEGIIGRTESELNPSEQADKRWQQEQKVLASGTLLEQVEEFQVSDSEVRYLDTIRAPLLDGAGNVIGLQGMFWDITDQHRLEKELQNERDLLHTLLNNVPDRIYFKDLQSRFVRVSHATLNLFKAVDSSEVIGKSDFDFFSEEHARNALEDEQRIIRSGQPVIGLVEKIEIPGGQRRWVSTTKMPRRDASGQVVGTFGITRDITQIKEAEAELQHERDLLHALLDNVPDRIYFKDRQSRILRMSRAHADLFSLDDPEQAVGKTDFDFFTSEHAQQAFDDEQRIIRTGEPIIGLVEKETLPGGVIRWASTTKMPLRNEKGDIVGTFGITRDITEMKQASEALREAKEAAEEANQTKSQFLANMSHELRTPLNSIIGFSNILLKNKTGHLVPSELSFLNRILANGKHLLELINQVLDLSKIEARKLELELTRVALDQLVNEVLVQMEGQLHGRELRLEAELPSRVQPIQTDAIKLKQVVINLVGNALKFTEQGSVTVRVVAEPGTGRLLRLEVADTGIGIPQDKLKKVFEAFAQADGGTSRRFGGTGLGLTISKSMCDLLGYKLKVESEPGKGSVFSVHFSGEAAAVKSQGAPIGTTTVQVLDEPVKSLEPGRRPAGSFSGKKVLVIDDEADARILMKTLLQELGCHVATASSGSEGLELARQYRPDLITTDLLMPGVNGWDVVKEINADPDLNDIPVVVISIVGSENRSTLASPVDILDKPVSREALSHLLGQRLAAHANVLIVDDDPDALQIVKAYLQDSGAQLLTAPNGREALRVLDESRVDIIVLDLVMPVMDGLTFLSALQKHERHRDIPVVVLTAKALSGTEKRTLSQQTLRVLRKGECTAEDLRNLLRHVWFPSSNPSGSDASA